MSATGIHQGNVLDVLAGLPAGYYHASICSPPYWGLRDYKLPPVTWGGDPACAHEWAEPTRTAWANAVPGPSQNIPKNSAQHWMPKETGPFCARCGAWRGCLGLEPTIDGYLAHLLAVFDAVRRVMRDDATCWVNMGDSWNGVGGQGAQDGGPVGATAALGGVRGKHERGLKAGDQCCVPERFKLAMIAAGWYCRQTIIWAKGLSFCASYSGSVMPESVNGTRWVRCRVKVETVRTASGRALEVGARLATDNGSRWSPCPGCDRCWPNDGWVLRRGSGRPTAAFEYVYQFAKSGRYYYDSEAVRERGAETKWHAVTRREGSTDNNQDGRDHLNLELACGGRNLRNVWAIGTKAYRGAHFATFPMRLVEPIIKAATSERGCCPACGAPWARCVESEYENPGNRTTNGPKGLTNADHGGFSVRLEARSRTLGWRPTCTCPAAEPGPCRVLDPFAGTGTTLAACMKLGRAGTGIELSQRYIDLARRRLARHTNLWTAAL